MVKLLYYKRDLKMERNDKFQLIGEKILPEFKKFWINGVTGELVFLNEMEMDRFKNKFKGRFKESFYSSIKVDPYDVTLVPFKYWIDEFILFDGES
jgi:hypothetical protein